MKAAPTVLTLLLLALTARAALHLDNGATSDAPQRGLAQEVRVESADFYDPLTADLSEYMDELEESLTRDSEDIEVHTALNVDRTYTTGNMDAIDDYDNLLPDYDQPVVDPARAQLAKAHQSLVRSVVQVFGPDPFSEDPRMFLGDHSAYFKIVKKRSLVFYYLSRAILYLAIFYIIVRFLSRRREEKEAARGVYSKREHRVVAWAQAVSIWALFVSAGAVFYLVGHPKAIIDNAGSTLIYNFREMNVTAHAVSDTINSINRDKIKITRDRYGFFAINNLIEASLPDVERDVELSKEFASTMLKNPHLTSYSTPIALFFFALVLAGLSGVAFVNKSAHFQVLLFLAGSLSLSYLVYSTGMYFSNFSGLHDICTSVIKVAEQDLMPESGMGLIRFVGCTAENVFFQQLVANLKAQNAARKLFNNELFKTKRDAVLSARDAIDTSDYLNRLDANNVAVRIFADLLQKNDGALAQLMAINRCNKVKSWLAKEEHSLCYESSLRFLYIFWLYLAIICVYFALLYSALRAADVLERLAVKKVVKQHTFDKLRYANDIKLN